MSIRNLLIGAGIVVLAGAGAAYGSLTMTHAESIEKQAALYQIEKIEKTWHKAASKHDLNLMMSIWAPTATATFPGTNGQPGVTVRGKKAIRAIFAKAGPFQTANHWVSETPAYKMRTTVNGNKGTLYFECHYLDVATGKLASAVGADQEVRRIRGKWLITNMNAAAVTLKP